MRALPDVVAGPGAGATGSLEGPTNEPTTVPTDRQLMDHAVAMQARANAAHAARLGAVCEFHSRRVADQEAARLAGRRPTSGRSATVFTTTPLRETCAEFGPLLAVGDIMIQTDLDTTETLQRLFPRVWSRFVQGRLDFGRARVVLDQLAHLAPEHHRAYARSVEDWFDRRDPLEPVPDHPLCSMTRSQIQRATLLRRHKLPPRPRSQTFAAAFEKRRVSLRVEEESGMAVLSAVTAAHDALTADYRLTLLAKRRAEAPGEERTLEQLRVDTLLDLLHGRLTVIGEDDQDGSCPGLELRDDVGGYARPIINVTVPITTLLGATDDPGTLCGTHPIPGDYARHIASDPRSTWYRMLTDPAGHFLALSTKSYTPSAPIWRETVARDPVCTWPTCTRPSTRCELDHRFPYPHGPTSTSNLHPLCRKHHRLKHDVGYHVARAPDGTTTWTTRHGNTFHTPPAEQPTAGQPTAAQPTTAQPTPGQPTAGHSASPVEERFRELLAA